MSGKLVFAGTPIGNPRDASLRLFDVIYESDIIIAEIDSTCHEVLMSMGINVLDKIKQYPNTMNINGGNYNIAEDLKILQEASNGKNILFLSDFGMPCISDPGSSLIKLARKNYPNLKIEVIPGPSAIPMSFIYADTSDDSEFHFYGFLDKKFNRYENIIKDISERKEETSIIFFPSYKNFNYAELLQDIYTAVGERKATICIDLTTPREKIINGLLSNIINEFREYTENGVFYVTLVLSRVDK